MCCPLYLLTLTLSYNICIRLLCGSFRYPKTSTRREMNYCNVHTSLCRHYRLMTCFSVVIWIQTTFLNLCGEMRNCSKWPISLLPTLFETVLKKKYNLKFLDFKTFFSDIFFKSENGFYVWNLFLKQFTILKCLLCTNYTYIFKIN